MKDTEGGKAKSHLAIRRSGDLAIEESSNRQIAKSQNRPIADSRHVSVRAEIIRVYERENADLKLKCPWSAKHAKLLQRVLAMANWPAADWHTCILHRFASEGIAKSEDPAAWIPRLFSYRRGPLNRFNKTDRVPESCLAKAHELYADYWAAYPDDLPGDPPHGPGTDRGQLQF